MKKYIQYFMTLLVAVLLPVAAICQEVAETVIDTFDPASIFISLSTLVVAVGGLTQWLKKAWKTAGIKTKLISWLVSFALAGVGWIFQFGIFEAISWYWALLYGLSAGLIANSIFEPGMIQSILTLLKRKSNA